MDTELISILACPRCRGGLTLVEEQGNAAGLSCGACATVYPVVEGIPVLLSEEAIPQEEWNNGRRGRTSA